MNQLEMLTVLNDQKIQGCTKCSELCTSRNKTVFGEGNPNATVMFIGEAPGHNEDTEGRPFVGPAGQLLDGMITACGLCREDVYIANCLKCRPPANRRPGLQELKNCWPYLDLQIKIINPKYIVCLGNTAAHRILGNQEHYNTITSLRGRPHSWQERTVICTYHPSYVLQAPDNKKDHIKQMIWSDLQLLMESLKNR